MKTDNLVRTQLGLVDPVKGKIVVSIRGLSGARHWNKENNTFNPPLESVKPAEPKKEEAPVKKATKKTTKAKKNTSE